MLQMEQERRGRPATSTAGSRSLPPYIWELTIYLAYAGDYGVLLMTPPVTTMLLLLYRTYYLARPQHSEYVCNQSNTYHELQLVRRGLEMVSGHFQDRLLILASFLDVCVAKEATVIGNHLLNGVVLNLDEIL